MPRQTGMTTPLVLESTWTLILISRETRPAAILRTTCLKRYWNSVAKLRWVMVHKLRWVMVHKLRWVMVHKLRWAMVHKLKWVMVHKLMMV